MTISKEAIEAAARAICLMEYGVEWEHMGETGRESCRREASVTLTAAAPAIRAAALAPILALHKPFTVHPSGIGTKYCVHCWDATEGGSAEWPCATARAATIEGESE